jgi:hypothetical protein
MSKPRMMTGYGVVAVSLAAAAIVGSAPSGAESVSNYQMVNVGQDDWIANYDNNTTTNNGSNVDWPIDMIYYGNATKTRVHNALESAGWHDTGSTVWDYGINYDGGSGAYWDNDPGRKTNSFPCTDTFHQRVYRDNGSAGKDYSYNTNLGFYVQASSHFDNNEGTFCPYDYSVGSNEDSEFEISGRMQSKGYTIYRDVLNLQNSNYNNIGAHHFSNNGLATKVYMP